MLKTLKRAINRLRLRAAEQDLRWMETIGQHNLQRQRQHVLTLRQQIGPTSAAEAEEQFRREMVEKLLKSKKAQA